MDPMSQLINDVSGGQGNMQQQPMPQQQTAPMFGSQTAQQPIAPTYQSQQPQQWQQQPYPTAPVQGQPVQQPQQQQFQQPTVPTGPLPAYSLNVPMQPVQPQQQDQTPAWAQQIIDAANASQQPEVQQPQTPSKGWDDPTQRPQTYEELRQAIEAAADNKLKSYIDQQNVAQQEARQQNQQAQQQIDLIEHGLRQNGLLAPIINPLDPNDAGKLAQRELEGYAIATQTNDLTAAAVTLKALHDGGVSFDPSQKQLVRRGSQTPNAFAPIAGSSPTVNGGGGIGITYGQMARSSIGELADAGMRMFQ